MQDRPSSQTADWVAGSDFVTADDLVALIDIPKPVERENRK